MDPKSNPPPTSPSDRSPAHPLEVSAALAAAVEQVLFGFAAKAELETALVVDLSGALVSGISADEDSEIDVVSVLAAGASGAIRALAKRLGEAGEIESFHHGSEQVVYLGGVGERFLLVGVCRSGTAIGAIREEARQVRPSLTSLLATLDETRSEAANRAAQPPAPANAAPPATPPAAPVPPPAIPLSAAPQERASREVAQPGPEEPARTGSRLQEAVSEITRPDPEPLPTEIIEYLGEDEPEIVVEHSSFALAGLPDSPFEIAEDEDFEEIEDFDEVEAPEFGDEGGTQADAVETADGSEALPEEPTFEKDSIFELEEEEDFLDADGASGPEGALGPADEGDAGGEEVPTAAAAEQSSKKSSKLPEPPEAPRSLFELAEGGEENMDDFEEPLPLGASGLLGDGSFEFEDESELDFDHRVALPPEEARDSSGSADEAPETFWAPPPIDDPSEPEQGLPQPEPPDFSEMEFDLDPDSNPDRDSALDNDTDLASAEEKPPVEDAADEPEEEPAVAKGPYYF